MMGCKSFLQAGLMLLFIIWREEMNCNALLVRPPENIQIIDPGHLGYLEITWSPPADLIEMTECPKLYELEYFNTYRNRWDVISTPRQTYSAQFDLMKDVTVRVYTLLSGPCTNDTWVRSTNYTELVQKPSSRGLMGTAVQDFNCIFYNMEHMICNWKQAPKTTSKSQQYLYFWHNELEHTEECPKYLSSKGIRTGCDFTEKVLPDFTDINFCINGSSPNGHLKPTYVSLQIQNHVKPKASDRPHVQTGPDAQLKLHWKKPAGRIPGHCLEWQVEHVQEGSTGKSVSVIHTKHLSLMLPSVRDNETNCFRVRSRLHKYCSVKSFWSNWSPQMCRPDTDTAKVRSTGMHEESLSEHTEA